MAAMGQGGGEGAGEAQGAAQGEAQGGPDLSQITDTLNGLGSSMEEMRNFLSSQPWQQAQQQVEQQAGEELDLSWLDTEVDPQAASARLNEVIQGAVDQRAQALMEPLRQQQTEMRRDQQARDLASEFPELSDPEMAQRLAGRGGLAEQAAMAIGNPELAAEPAFWRLAYMAHKAAEAANQEGVADPQAASLESGVGAGPGPTQEDLVNAIVNADGGLGHRVLDGM